MKTIAKFILRILGWKTIDGPAPDKKCLILGVPHTSGWDFIISYLYYAAVGGKAYIMVKKSFFIGPLGPLMRKMGGIPVDRKKGATVAKQVIDFINNTETIHMAIAPEGTRQRMDRWKTGFHTIAKACDIPVYLGYFDWGKKEVGVGEKFELSDDAQADLKRIREHYRKIGVKGKHPELFSTGNDLD